MLPRFKDSAELAEFSLEEGYDVIYDELRRLAAYYLKAERPNHTLQPTALVHETYLRLVKQENQIFLNRTQFIALAANMMRRILVNHALHRNRQKRDGNLIRVTIDKAINEFAQSELNLCELDEALNKLAELNKRQARIFELRFFGGLTVGETTDV